MFSNAAEPTLFPVEEHIPSGVISKVITGGNSAVATLDRPINGIQFVVIGDGTKGRLQLVSNGLLKAGTKLRFPELERGTDAYAARSVILM